MQNTVGIDQQDTISVWVDTQVNSATLSIPFTPIVM
jgi:hypothetical protein